MSISATILDELKIKPHTSFKGRSVYKSGKKIIISENCGREIVILKEKIFISLLLVRSIKCLF